jgi:hypothetical protein
MMKRFCLLTLLLASISVSAKKNDDCIVDLVEMRAPLVDASLWANARFPQLDIAIVLNMATAYVDNPIPLEKLLADNDVAEIAIYLEKAAEAHQAYGVKRALAKPPEEMREAVERLYEVERNRTVEFLNLLIGISGRDPQKTPIDDFYILRKWPQKYAIAKGLTEVFEAYLQSSEFRNLALELRENIRNRVRIGDTWQDLLDPVEDRLEAGIITLCKEKNRALLPAMKRFWVKLRELG